MAIRTLAAAFGMVLCLACAGPAAAQAAPGGCYPPPCATSTPVPSLLQAASSGQQPVGLASQSGGSSPAPFVVIGLLMVATSFTVIVLSRRGLVSPTASPVVLRGQRDEPVILREPDASFR